MWLIYAEKSTASLLSFLVWGSNAQWCVARQLTISLVQRDRTSRNALHLYEAPSSTAPISVSVATKNDRSLEK